jgi:uncharacterized membrane protein
MNNITAETKRVKPCGIIYRIAEAATVFIIGGFCYTGMEILWRGSSHWTMVIAGGFCLYCIYLIVNGGRKFNFFIGLVSGSFLITVVEFITGCIVNLFFKWNVWDYSYLPFNIMGQICALYTSIWFFVCIPAVLISRFLKIYIFNNKINDRGSINSVTTQEKI